MRIDPAAFASAQILSTIDDANIGVASYQRGSMIETLAFVRGLPVPFDILTTLLMRRLVGKQLDASIPYADANLSARLKDLWDGATMPAFVELARNGDSSEYWIAYEAVQKLFRSIKAESDDAGAGFSAMIVEMEARLEASLATPVVLQP